MAFSPLENKLTVQTNVFSIQLLNCNPYLVTGKNLFNTGSGKAC